MAKESQIVTEFMCSEVGTEVDADIYCRICTYRAVIKLCGKFESFRNPNYRVIINPRLKGTYFKYVELQPDAIKAVLNSVKLLLCPKCGEQRMQIAGNSKYNPHRIIASIRCQPSF